MEFFPHFLAQCVSASVAASHHHHHHQYRQHQQDLNSPDLILPAAAAAAAAAAAVASTASAKGIVDLLLYIDRSPAFLTCSDVVIRSFEQNG